jgi:hypothetical protein
VETSYAYEPLCCHTRTGHPRERGAGKAGDTDMKGGGQNSSSVSRSVAGELFLTSPDKHSIYQAVADDKGQSIPLTFHPMIGAKVPDSLALFDLPGKVTNQVPAVKNHQYAKLNSNDALLVDPKDREVAAVINASQYPNGSKKNGIKSYAINPSARNASQGTTA